MKKIILVIVLMASTLVMNAQEFKIGAGGGIFSTWLVNKNVSDQGDDLDFAATFGGQFGLNAQYYFKDNLGLTFGLLYSGHNQKYTGEESAGGITVSYEFKTKMRYLDIPVFIRTGGGAKGAYFEFGPQFGFLMSAKDEASASGGGLTFDTSDVDVKSTLKSSNIALVLGFGVDIDASENVIITTGLRLGYGLTDVTKEYKDEAALNAETENVALPTAFAHNHQNDSGGDSFKYASTNRAFGGLFISVLFKIPSKK
ncbi:MAG: porin family protein [Bacteroidia bacterium]